MLKIKRIQFTAIIIAALTMMVSFFAYGAPTKSEHPKSNFEFYHDLCKNLPPMSDKTAPLPYYMNDPDSGSGMMYGMSPAMNVGVPPKIFLASAKEAFAHMRYLKPGSELESILNDPDFNRAIEACWPHDPQSKYFFTAAFINDDAQGKLVAGLGTVVITKGSVMMLSRLSAMGSVGSAVAKGAAALFALQTSVSLIESYIRIQEKLHPEQKNSPEIQKLLRARLAQVNADIADWQTLQKNDPKDPEITKMLNQAMALRQRIINDIEGRSPHLHFRLPELPNGTQVIF